MKYPWLNMKQEEVLRPYSEAPRGDMNHQVTGLCTGQDPGVNNRKYNKVEGTYLIQSTTKTR